MKKFIMVLAFVFMFSGCGAENDNEIIQNGVYKYVSAPYKRYYDDELRTYFTDNIVRDIKYLYMPYVYNNDGFSEMFCFEESDVPDIEILNIEKKDKNSYSVKVKFGETEYQYDIALSDKKISGIEKRLKF